MKERKWKKIALWATGTFVALTAVLAIHIWWVMKPRIDAHTEVMARIDLLQPVRPGDAAAIQAWLYEEKGVRHVLVNPTSRIAVFSFSPLENDANRIVAGFTTHTAYRHATRYLPGAAALSGGCPAAATNLTYRVFAFLKRIL